MNLRCVYCAYTWKRDERPPACPRCETPFSLLVTPDTPVRDIVMAIGLNGRDLDSELRARLPEQHPLHIAGRRPWRRRAGRSGGH